MTRILAISASAALAEKIAQLNLEIVSDVQAYRDMVCSLGSHSDLVPSLESEPRPAPKFGGDRPYLKRKKGRS